jgi:predicted nucleic acid-binding protein
MREIKPQKGYALMSLRGAELRGIKPSPRIKPKDSLNIACAIVSNCDYFITTDIKLLNKNINGIKIINPMDFIIAMEEKDED